jgi:hypothetical protein
MRKRSLNSRMNLSVCNARRRIKETLNDELSGSMAGSVNA